jgi:hypothetical protein
MCAESQIDSMPSYFRLLEEARKVWDYFFSDKLIYLSEGMDSGDPLLLVSEYNFGLRQWIELHIRLVGQSEEYLHMIMELVVPNGHGTSGGEVILGNCGMKRDVTVFIDIPKRIQNPEIVEPIPLPTLVWLQRSNISDCFLRDSKRRFSELNLAVEGVYPLNRERDSFVGGNTISVERSQLPCQMVQRGPETADKIASDQSNAQIQLAWAKLNNILSTFKIVIARNTLSLFFVPEFHEFAQSIQVHLRPGDLMSHRVNL